MSPCPPSVRIAGGFLCICLCYNQSIIGKELQNYVQKQKNIHEIGEDREKTCIFVQFYRKV